MTNTENTNTETTTATQGSTVTVHYRGTLSDGTEFDNSHNRGEPIQFVVGSGQMLPGFEGAITGLSAGDTNTVTLNPAEAYGEVDETRRTSFPVSGFPDGIELTEGMPVPLRTDTGQTIVGRLLEFDENIATVDLNHPLAGETLQFEVELVAVTTGTDTQV